MGLHRNDSNLMNVFINLFDSMKRQGGTGEGTGWDREGQGKGQGRDRERDRGRDRERTGKG